MKSNNLVLICIDGEMSGTKLFHKDFGSASRSRPVPYSLLSLGACAIKKTKEKWKIYKSTFYEEITPLDWECCMAYDERYDYQAMKIACSQLHCLENLKKKDSKF